MTHHLNSDNSVAVADDNFLLPITKDTPRGVKLLLLGSGGVLTIGHWDGRDPFFIAWAPLPKRDPRITYEPYKP